MDRGRVSRGVIMAAPVLNADYSQRVKNAERQLYDANQLLPKAKAIGCQCEEIEAVISELQQWLTAIRTHFFDRA